MTHAILCPTCRGAGSVRPDAEPNCEICKHARAVLREWLDKQGHDRCHYYPEIFNELSQLFGLKATKEAALPPRKEFEAGCARFADEEYGRCATEGS